MNGSEILFLIIDDVLILHELQLERYGGAVGIRNRSLLESAIHMPQASFDGAFMHTNIFEWQQPMLFTLLRTNLLWMATSGLLWMAFKNLCKS